MHTGEKLEGKAARNSGWTITITPSLLKQYRRVAYSVFISESELNLRMEMEHGTRLSTLEVNAELAGIDLSNTKLENHTKSVIRSKTMLDIINTALEAVRQDPDRGELMRIRSFMRLTSPRANPNGVKTSCKCWTPGDFPISRSYRTTTT